MLRFILSVSILCSFLGCICGCEYKAENFRTSVASVPVVGDLLVLEVDHAEGRAYSPALDDALGRKIRILSVYAGPGGIRFGLLDFNGETAIKEEPVSVPKPAESVGT